MYKKHTIFHASSTGKISVFRLLKDPRMEMIYEDALKEGQSEVNRIRIMLVGKYGAGKTSVMRSLLGEDFEDKHLETIGVETEGKVDVYLSAVEENVRWQKVCN